MTIAALFVDERGPYAGLDGVEVWGITRDARRYPGPHPVVAHPPCSRWCQLAHVVQARWGHVVGDDGGCFASALASVRRWGGVLEHPAWSLAWPRYNLATPALGAWSRDLFDGGWVTCVQQRAYGHRARKATWLYYVGASEPPALDWSTEPPVATVSYMTNHGGGDLPRLSKREASATPTRFRDVLIALARNANQMERVA